MKHITYTCDRCGKRTDKANGLPIMDLENVDLCDKCFVELRGVIGKFIDNVENEPKRIDDGKIGALRRAGWTIQAIAEEIGCSKPTVINHLKAMGIEKGVEA